MNLAIHWSASNTGPIPHGCFPTIKRPISSRRFVHDHEETQLLTEN
jgi:hypothetical protein